MSCCAGCVVLLRNRGLGGYSLSLAVLVCSHTLKSASEWIARNSTADSLCSWSWILILHWFGATWCILLHSWWLSFETTASTLSTKAGVVSSNLRKLIFLLNFACKRAHDSALELVVASVELVLTADSCIHSLRKIIWRHWLSSGKNVLLLHVIPLISNFLVHNGEWRIQIILWSCTCSSISNRSGWFSPWGTLPLKLGHFWLESRLLVQRAIQIWWDSYSLGAVDLVLILLEFVILILWLLISKAVRIVCGLPWVTISNLFKRVEDFVCKESLLLFEFLLVVILRLFLSKLCKSLDSVVVLCWISQLY